MTRALVVTIGCGVALRLNAQMTWPGMALAFVWMAPWLAMLDTLPTRRAALAAGAAMSVAYVVGVFPWFAPAVARYTGWPPAAAWAAVVVLAPLLEPQVVLVPLARRLLVARGLGWPLRGLGTAAAWVALEWLSPKLFGDTLAHGLYGARWLRQAADVGGTAGLTVVLVFANEAALAAARAAWAAGGGVAPRVRAAVPGVATAATLVAALAAYGAARCAALDAVAASAPTVAAGLVQANLAGYDRLRAEVGTYEAVRRILDLHLRLSTAALDARPLDLLVWPETVYPTTFGAPKSEAGGEFDAEIARLAAVRGVPLVFGAYDADDDGREYNAAVFLEAAPGGGRVSFETYRKASLFPLTERVPWWLEGARAWLPWMGTWRPGSGARVVDVALRDGRTVRVAPLICYDDVNAPLALAAVRGGAEVLLGLSNDAWFAGGEGARMHLVMAAFRSIETRRPQLRATNTGISAAIDPAGDVRETAAAGERTVLVAHVRPERAARPLAVAWGDWVGPTAAVVVVLLLAVPRRRRAAPAADDVVPVARRAAGGRR